MQITNLRHHTDTCAHTYSHTQHTRVYFTPHQSQHSVGSKWLCACVQDILLTAVDLLKLEKVEFGGVRGRGLSQQVQCLHQEFLDTYKTLTEKPYDCLDLNNKVQRRLAYREIYKDTNPLITLNTAAYTVKYKV